MSDALQSFLEARDFLFTHREDYDTAYADFRWPRFDKFNWALDYFDVIAQDNSQAALWVVEESGHEIKLSYAEMSARSNQAANFLRGQGVKRGDVVLIMLGNVVPLWEVMLACIKLGAVMIPATTLLNTEDLKDRFERGGVRHVVVSAADAAKFEPLSGEYSRITVDGAVEGWTRYEDAYAASTEFTADGSTAATDPLLL
ncbi:MAG TPA: AMP-binding protein, partial [Patescibacteria group bacterium]|nr:AMP-binding protein [Patescibacteria group bacterium]